MGSKLIRFCLISIVITNIIFFIFVLIIRQFNYDEIIFKNEFIYEIFEKIDISIYFHYIMLPFSKMVVNIEEVLFLLLNQAKSNNRDYQNELTKHT